MTVRVPVEPRRHAETRDPTTTTASRSFAREVAVGGWWSRPFFTRTTSAFGVPPSLSAKLGAFTATMRMLFVAGSACPRVENEPRAVAPPASKATRIGSSRPSGRA